ncbi:hypothetical protein DLM_3911 [Aquitalea magnusonii]|uniref:Uncharacterized protein n=1 Tax=Aquitalea magnusonii TaxID=332411 RepID=A0A3G9GHZ4_9NEIS|nr:hypothetical protein DLM_3911 [Aquitalea magnusonii]
MYLSLSVPVCAGGVLSSEPDLSAGCRPWFLAFGNMLPQLQCSGFATLQALGLGVATLSVAKKSGCA